MKLDDLLGDVRTIAVVGVSSKADKAGCYVPAYLQGQGFHILPVSPALSEWQGQRAYPNLESLPQGADLVLLFRRSEDVPGHLEDILKIRPRVVWMQSGIRHPVVARRLEEEGILVVQDRCLMVEHRRLPDVYL